MIHGDGVWGGPTPQGNIAIGFFSERNTTPRTVDYAVSDGALGEEIERDFDPGFLREIESTVVVSPATAYFIARWLKEQLALLGWQE